MKPTLALAFVLAACGGSAKPATTPSATPVELEGAPAKTSGDAADDAADDEADGGAPPDGLAPGSPMEPESTGAPPERPMPTSAPPPAPPKADKKSRGPAPKAPVKRKGDTNADPCEGGE